jgi:GNAT superfamily N-acetyltransferase
MVEIVPFSNQSPSDWELLKQFVGFHWSHYENDVQYIPLLDFEYLGSKLLGMTGFLEDKNLFFEHGETRFFLAKRDGKVVGRLNAFTNRSHNHHWNDRVGFFGHFECIQDDEVAQSLLKAGEDWLQSQGMTIVRGPQNFPINEATPGFMVEGFNSRPVVYYHHNKSYYAELAKTCGYSPVMDVLSWELSFPSRRVDEVLGPISQKIIDRNQVVLESWGQRKKSVRKHEMFEIYNDAWSDNFGFVPFRRKEFDKIIDDMALIFEKDLFLFAYIDGRPAAFFGAVPNIFEVMAVKDNYRRSELLRAIRLVLNRSRIRGFRFGYLGVKKEYRNLGLDAVLIWKQYKIAIEKGYQYCDMGWVLSNNKPVIRMVERCGAVPSKRYSIFEKTLN